MTGKTHSAETKANMSKTQINIDRTGENNPFYGRIHSAEFKSRMSEIMSGKVKSEETKQKMSEAKSGENRPNFGITPSDETKVLISSALGGGTIYVYNSEGTLVNTFCSTRKAAEEFGCSHVTIANYIKNGELFQDKWILTLSVKE
jgi:hypothetical protein